MARKKKKRKKSRKVLKWRTYSPQEILNLFEDYERDTFHMVARNTTIRLYHNNENIFNASIRGIYPYHEAFEIVPLLWNIRRIKGYNQIWEARILNYWIWSRRDWTMENYDTAMKATEILSERLQVMMSNYEAGIVEIKRFEAGPVGPALPPCARWHSIGRLRSLRSLLPHSPDSTP